MTGDVSFAMGMAAASASFEISRVIDDDSVDETIHASLETARERVS